MSTEEILLKLYEILGYTTKQMVLIMRTEEDCRTVLETLFPIDKYSSISRLIDLSPISFYIVPSNLKTLDSVSILRALYKTGIHTGINTGINTNTIVRHSVNDWLKCRTVVGLKTPDDQTTLDLNDLRSTLSNDLRSRLSNDLRYQLSGSSSDLRSKISEIKKQTC
jgi:hypothetical protein